MALNMLTDKQFDEALEWLSKKEKKTKSDVIRNLLLERYHDKRKVFQFGALATHVRKKPTLKQTLEELKEMDNDHDLD